VVDSRTAADGAAVRRRRECRSCGTRFTTFERVELPELLVRKRSGLAVPFDRTRVREGMARAARDRISPADLDRAALVVEHALRSGGGGEVTSEQVGRQVLARLRDLDDVTYVRFASVYKDFQAAEDFALELASLRKEAPPKGV